MRRVQDSRLWPSRVLIVVASCGSWQRDQKGRNCWRSFNLECNERSARRVLVSWISCEVGAKTPECHRQTWRFLGRFRLFLSFRWRGMDLNHQPRAYELSSCPRRHPIPETTLRAISLGQCPDTSLGLSSWPAQTASTVPIWFHYMRLTHDGNKQFICKAFTSLLETRCDRCQHSG